MKNTNVKTTFLYSMEKLRKEVFKDEFFETVAKVYFFFKSGILSNVYISVTYVSLPRNNHIKTPKIYALVYM